MEILKQVAPYIVTLITGVISAVVAIHKSNKECKQQLRVLEQNNKNEIDKLIKKNDLDIESLKENHRLELEKKELEHKHQIELLNIQNENEIKQTQKANESLAMNNVLEGVFSDFAKQAFNSPQIQNKINETIQKSFDKKN